MNLRWLRFDGRKADLDAELRMHRQMRRSPSFAATVVGTLALGIAAAAAMFTVVDRVLLEPVTYRDPSRLVILHESDRKDGISYGTPWVDMQQWREQSRSFSGIAFTTGWGSG